MSIGEWLAVAGVLVTVGTLIAKLQSQEAEILKLRAWRHQIGDDPSHEAMVMIQDIDKRVERLERERKR